MSGEELLFTALVGLGSAAVSAGVTWYWARKTYSEQKRPLVRVDLRGEGAIWSKHKPVTYGSAVALPGVVGRRNLKLVVRGERQPTKRVRLTITPAVFNRPFERDEGLLESSPLTPQTFEATDIYPGEETGWPISIEYIDPAEAPAEAVMSALESLQRETSGTTLLEFTVRGEYKSEGGIRYALPQLLFFAERDNLTGAFKKVGRAGMGGQIVRVEQPSKIRATLEYFHRLLKKSADNP